ncbi:hypothetical protein AcV7_008840 [Taiwanofungus camphoratus]|nr:hypothetical protein AcV7_008840 [Antrodia cinnamomea]
MIYSLANGRLRRLIAFSTLDSQPAQAKRRRSSAQPTLGGPSRRKTSKLTEHVVIEESEPEEDKVVRKVGRSKKSSTDAGTQARRVSQAHPEDSGWEDNNVFQSGAESSSPARPPPPRTRGTRCSSALPRPMVRSRKSMSAPPQYASASPPKSSQALVDSDAEEEEEEKTQQERVKDKGKEKEKEMKKEERESAKPASRPSTKPPSRASTSGIKPPSGAFAPRLPPGVARETRASVARATRHTLVPEALAERQVVVVPDDLKEEEEEEEEETQLQRSAARLHEAIREAQQARGETEMGEEGLSEEDIDVDERVAAISQRIADGGGQVIRRKRTMDNTASSLLLRVLLTLLALLGSSALYQYKTESAGIGFCDVGVTTNAVVEAKKVHYLAVESCNRENRTTLYVQPNADSTSSVVSPVPAGGVPSSALEGTLTAEPCPLLPLVPQLHPEMCTSCPAHASCTPTTITCDSGFILRAHPLLAMFPVPGTAPRLSGAPSTFTRPAYSPSTDVTSDAAHMVYAAVGLALDGMPGVGSVALPPRCVEDPRRKRHIGVLGKAVEAMLAAERGRRLCEDVGIGVDEREGDEAVEARRWGMELEKLKDDLRRKTAPNLQITLDDTFNEAVQQLVQWGGVFMGEDADGKRYLAHRTPSMSWDCALRVKARDAWAEWNRAIAGSALLVLGVLAFRRRQAQRGAESARVAGLVQVALDLLRNQELAHHTDPVTAPAPYLSSLQLRDLVLQDEHSVRTRRRLWERVERVVEGNTNVRTNLEEVQGGDELRVWRWVGGAGAISPRSGGTKRLASEEKGASWRIVA